jgi:hypothetical protein
MKRWSRFFSWLRKLANLEVGPYLRPTPGKVAALGFFLVLFSLAYLLGAAVMYFRWPSAVYLTKAFMGAEDWAAQGHDLSGAADDPTERPKVILDKKGAAYDGYTLCMSLVGPQAALLDMRGGVVHRWKANSRLDWSRAPHVTGPLPNESVHWDNCHVYPDGALLALCSRESDAYGYGLMKLDKNSNFLWAYSANVHHDFTVGDDGRIYALTYGIDSKPPPGLPGGLSQVVAEYLVVLSQDGRQLATIPLLKAFYDSNFASLFASQLWRNKVPVEAAPTEESFEPGTRLQGDFLHANSVKVLPRALAAKFPLFKPGWALLSFRSPSIIALIDPEKGRVVWAAIGPWQGQHDAQFLENGRLLLFDNAGAGPGNGPRVLEYDPVSQGIPWEWFPNDRYMKAPFRGACQRLPNGNTLISDWRRSAFEVTPNKETVWESTVPALIRARRYAPEELPFLPAGTTPRKK